MKVAKFGVHMNNDCLVKEVTYMYTAYIKDKEIIV